MFHIYPTTHCAKTTRKHVTFRTSTKIWNRSTILSPTMLHNLMWSTNPRSWTSLWQLASSTCICISNICRWTKVLPRFFFYLLLSSSTTLRAPWTELNQNRPYARKWVRFKNVYPKSGVSPHPKNRGPKTTFFDDSATQRQL